MERGSIKGNESERRTKTESVSFRIERSVLDTLRQESEQKFESLNVLVNQIFRFYTDYHKPLLISGNTYFSKAFISKVFDILNDEQIGEIAEDYVRRVIREQMQMARCKYVFSDYIYGLRRWLDVSSFPYIVDRTDSSDFITIRFDMGERWSAFFGKVHEILFKDLKIENSKVEVTGNAVTLTVQK
jgi:hypothetical protein